MQEALRTAPECLISRDSEGPTMGEMPARLIEGVGRVDQRARRILARLGTTGQDLSANIVVLFSEERGPSGGKAS